MRVGYRVPVDSWRLGDPMTPGSSHKPVSRVASEHVSEIVVQNVYAQSVASTRKCADLIAQAIRMTEEDLVQIRELKREYRDLRLEVTEALGRSFSFSPEILAKYSGDVSLITAKWNLAVKLRSVATGGEEHDAEFASGGEASSDREDIEEQ